MTPDLTIESIIDACRKAAGSPTLFKDTRDDGGQWSFYLPGLPPFECFRISVSPPTGDVITVTAGAVDTNDNTETNLRQAWEGRVPQLRAMLTSAVATIEYWKVRPQQVPESPGMRYRDDGTPLPSNKNH